MFFILCLRPHLIEFIKRSNCWGFLPVLWVWFSSYSEMGIKDKITVFVHAFSVSLFSLLVTVWVVSGISFHFDHAWVVQVTFSICSDVMRITFWPIGHTVVRRCSVFLYLLCDPFMFVVAMCVYAKLLSHVWLFATLWTVAHRGILQARILDWIAISFSRESSWPRDQTLISCIFSWAGGFFTTSATWEAPVVAIA